MKYHFIGIGGISMSGLAQLLLAMGNEVTGCDIKKIQVASQHDSRQASGKIKFFQGHSENHITKDLDGVIVTAAALHDKSPAKEEIKKAEKLDIPIIKRSEMIGKLMGKPGVTGIAVSGMHGKTTVSTMISLILEAAGFDPTCLIGSDVKEWQTNWRLGKTYKISLGKNTSEVKETPHLGGVEDCYFVAEACEYERQMLDFRPKILVITNLEAEHLDTYPGGIKDIRQTFGRFIRKLPKDGLLVVWREDQNLMRISQIAKKRGNTVREVSMKKIWPGLKLKVPGKYNLLDATFAARVCHELGVSSKTIQKTLNNFTGSSRRFEIKGEINHITVVDDYGHHPTEIKATIEAAKEYQISKIKYQKSKLIVVFQPHQYTRTKLLFKDFVTAFKGVDKLIITDIYLISGREPAEARADFSRELVNEIKNQGIDTEYAPTYQDAKLMLKKIAMPGDVIITQGATDIYKVGEDFLKK